MLALGRAATGPRPAPGALAEDPLDQAIWDSAIPAATVATACLSVLPFDHDRQMSSALVQMSSAPVQMDDRSALLAVKRAPEARSSTS